MGILYAMCFLSHTHTQKKCKYYRTFNVTFHMLVLNVPGRELPGGPVVRTWCLHQGPGSTPSQRTKIPQKEKVVKKSQCENEIKKVK